jgi:GT2 family glycosyltransferase
VRDLLANLDEQRVRPLELVLVDGAPAGEDATQAMVRELAPTVSFEVRYVRYGGGTAIQRNRGIDEARGEFVAFIDDDVRLDSDFFERMLEVFEADVDRAVGGIMGYRTNVAFSLDSAQRWRWYRRLKLLSTFEPGSYDFRAGYPINGNMQPEFTGTRPVQVMTTSCAVWRREVFEAGLRFDEFFRDYGTLEDAHLSLRASTQWQLLHCGDARCVELHAAGGRPSSRRVGFKSVVNYHYVFRSIEGPLSVSQRWRFWQFQAFELLRVGSSAVRRRRRSDLEEVLGRLEGVVAVARGATKVPRCD